MKCVEFLGLPGSGKTTIAREIRMILRSRQQRVFTGREARHLGVRQIAREKEGFQWRAVPLAAYLSKNRLLDSLWGKDQYPVMVKFMSTYPELVRQVLAYARDLVPPSWIPRDIVCGQNLLKWFFDAANVYQIACDYLREEDVLLLEEGFCQQSYYLLAFQKNGIDPRHIEEYLRLIPKSDLLVILLPSPEQCEARMRSRPKGISSDILRPLTVPQRLELLEQRLSVYKTIAAYLETHHIPVARLENEDYDVSQNILKQSLRAL